jgi:large subunit ribosomal protein L25
MAERRSTLSVEPRSERGSRASRRLRRDGYVPGVVYGRGDEPTAFKVDARRVRAILGEGLALFDVEVNGDRLPVIIKEQQRDPIQGRLVHLDLLKVRLDEKIQSTVPLEIEGVEEAPGVKEGGVLEHVTRELNIEALPTDIPDRIVADVSGLGIAETLTLESVTAPAGVTLLDNLEETVVATVTAPSEVIEEPEVEEEAELVGEELPEGEAPPEGEGEEPAAEEAGGEQPAEGES